MFILLSYTPAVITHGGQQLGRSKRNLQLKSLLKLRRERDLEVASSPPPALALPGEPVATTLGPETTVSSSSRGLALDRQVEGNTAPPVALKAAENPLFDVSRR